MKKQNHKVTAADLLDPEFHIRCNEEAQHRIFHGLFDAKRLPRTKDIDIPEQKPDEEEKGIS